MLIHEIKKYADELKEKQDPMANIVGMLYSQCLTKEKLLGGLTEESIFSIVRHLQQGIRQNKNSNTDKAHQEKCDKQIETLQRFLPVLLPEEQITHYIKLIMSPEQYGKAATKEAVFSQLDLICPNQYDPDFVLKEMERIGYGIGIAE